MLRTDFEQPIREIPNKVVACAASATRTPTSTRRSETMKRSPPSSKRRLPSPSRARSTPSSPTSTTSPTHSPRSRPWCTRRTSDWTKSGSVRSRRSSSGGPPSRATWLPETDRGRKPSFPTSSSGRRVTKSWTSGESWVRSAVLASQSDPPRSLLPPPLVRFLTYLC